MTPWWDARPVWAVKAKDTSFLEQVGLRFGGGAQRLEEALRASPGPWFVRHGDWIVVIGATRAPDAAERLVLRGDLARDHFFAERTTRGAVVRRVARTGDRRVDEGRRGQKREPDLTRLDAAGVAALARGWGVDLDVLPRALASRLEPSSQGSWSWRFVRLGLAAGLALYAARLSLPGDGPPPVATGGLGVHPEACADRDCAACVACVRADRDDGCDVLRAGCDADPDCRAIRACVTGCAELEVPGGRALDPDCRARCASADAHAVALAEAWLRCPYGRTTCPACATLRVIPEL